MKKFYLLVAALLLFTNVHIVNAYDATPTTQTCISVNKSTSKRNIHKMFFETDYKVKDGEVAFLQMCMHPKNGPAICAPFGADQKGAENTKDNLINLCKQKVKDFASLSANQKQDVTITCLNEAQDIVTKIDKITNNNHHFNYLKDTSTGKMLTQPLVAGTQIKNLEWSDYTKNEVTRSWYLVTLQKDVQAQITSFPVSTDGGLQHGTQGFLTTCNQITYDPAGVVFDAATSEPINGAKVVLYAKDGTDYKLIDNLPEAPREGYVSEGAGNFTFIVPKGLYKLDVLPVEFVNPTRMEAPFINSQIETDVKKIKGYDAKTNSVYTQVQGQKVLLYNNIYPLSNKNYPPINVTDEGAIVNIPIKAGLYKTSIEVLTATVNAVPGFGVQVQGRVNMPYALVKINAKSITADSGAKQVALATADINGEFDLTVPLSNLSKNMQITSVAATRQAQNSTVTNESSELPITSVVWYESEFKGTAQDVKGEVLPGARVEFFVPGFTTAYAQTKANAVGQFKIDSKLLPPNGFTIVYKDAKQSVLVNQNLKDYIVTQQQAEHSTNVAQKNQQVKTIKNVSKSNLSHLVFLVVLLLIVLFVAVFYFITHKATQKII